MVTAELAVGMVALSALLVAVVGVVAVLIAQMRCVDAAYATARAASRGEPSTQARHIGEAVAPERASIEVTKHGTVVRARVRANVRAFGPLLPAITVHASAAAEVEPGMP